jgi:BirA family biotin operon repressor/biotin-[acetyl-CoA-carboxylase] ligase
LDEVRFSRSELDSHLETRSLGRRLILLERTTSTNDAAWDALAAGDPHGAAIVAEAQTRGRGRSGRRWHTAKGLGLALSLLVRDPTTLESLPLLPLASGLAVARALRDAGARAELKWPNDVLISCRKVAGILCESRGTREPSNGMAAVIGIGVNVGQTLDDFPDELRSDDAPRPATSLALEGVAISRERIAASILNHLEVILDDVCARGAAPMLADWRALAAFWGERVRVRGASGAVIGIAESLDVDGALVLALEGGGRVRVMAGELQSAPDRSEARGENVRG